MLLRNPEEFDRVARDWAANFAGAPSRDKGESSGAVSEDSLKAEELRAQKAAEEQELAV